MKIFRVLCLLLLIAGFSFLSPAKTSGQQASRKIVVLKTVVGRQEAGQWLSRRGLTVRELPLVNGLAVSLPPEVEGVLSQTGLVERIDEDLVLAALERNSSLVERLARWEAFFKPRSKPTQPEQTVPWGVAKVEGPAAWPASYGTGVKVAVVDTGIDNNHPDLVDNIAGGYNSISPRRTWDDDNGHGTHVAGTIAAVDNAIGVVGVSPKARLYAVKVLDRRGYGYLSDIIEGLDWAISNKVQVVNLSLGGSGNETFHQAIQRTVAAGVVVVAAAGNSGGAVIYPAAYEEVMAVSAIDQSDTITSWSSRGPEVDLAAPGLGINSTWNDGFYKEASGTSMATPHVSGAAALVLALPVSSSWDADADGQWQPAEVQAALEGTATDLGDAGKDTLYGAGLVNAKRAVGL